MRKHYKSVTNINKNYGLHVYRSYKWVWKVFTTAYIKDNIEKTNFQIKNEKLFTWSLCTGLTKFSLYIQELVGMYS